MAVCAVASVASVAAGFAFARTAASPRTAGVVVVRTNLAYQGAAAAGTGIVLTSSGKVLTNNHVIRGATTIRVVVPGGRTYRAEVVGYSVAEDVAVLKVAASGLRTVSLGDSSKLRLGQQVTALGNAGGTGSLTPAVGRITGLGRTITAGDENGSSERLTGLIATSAALQPGDSGGPLLDAANRVIGIDTAASRGFVFDSAANGGFAIPIRRALSIAKLIDAGRASATVHVGPTAFLGVQVQSSDVVGGAVVTGVVNGSPADGAGLESGDVITAVDGHAVDRPETLTSLLLRNAPAATVQLTWADSFGNEQTAAVTLASGPPQ
jgi:S1-C subfamily serine protease